jgi:hypothetical protein
MIDIDVRTNFGGEIYSVVVSAPGRDSVEITGSNEDAILKILKVLLEVRNND